ncbi:MAG TPA: hypothetical protein VGF61_20780 [Candidatus Acidoferrum sp.]
MKFRMIAVILAFAIAAWLPAAGQQASGQSTPQNPAPADSTKDAAKHPCCCSHENHTGDSGSAADHDAHAMACCQAKDGKEMSCCSKDSKASKTAMTCCKDKDANLCAAKDGKPCCDTKAGKSCCGKDATACNSKAGKDCCTGKDEACCKHATA